MIIKLRWDEAPDTVTFHIGMSERSKWEHIKVDDSFECGSARTLVSDTWVTQAGDTFDVTFRGPGAPSTWDLLLNQYAMETSPAFPDIVAILRSTKLGPSDDGSLDAAVFQTYLTEDLSEAFAKIHELGVLPLTLDVSTP